MGSEMCIRDRGVNVCRISGQLPNDGCDSVEVMSRDGSTDRRSMIYTEYFVRGSQPGAVCQLHPRRSFMETLAGVFGGESGPPPIPAESTGLPSPPAVPTAGSRPRADAAQSEPAAPAAENAEEPRRRGFWGRLFGRGSDDERKAREEERRKQEEQRRREAQQKKPGGG